MMGRAARLLTLMRPVALIPSAFLVAAGADTRSVVFVKRDATTLLSELNDRADPSSTAFLKWMTKDEVAAVLRPNPAHLEHVILEATRHGASSVSVVGGDKVEVFFPAEASSAAYHESMTRAAHAVDFVVSSGVSVSSGASAAAAFSLSTAPRGSRSHRRKVNSTTAAAAFRMQLQRSPGVPGEHRWRDRQLHPQGVRPGRLWPWRWRRRPGVRGEPGVRAP
ncbi:unnamed protein product [Prorocentrum cordatum]|uniref:Uncharacterized protein n=1 Tax=Prorocentrum cordatum TaxID=2364126 RepID=A0ABN9SQ75_9DINO|nr:unnamed protein product [Polarella glacialis]